MPSEHSNRHPFARAACVLGLLACLSLLACNRDPRILSQRCVTSGNKYFKNGKFSEASILYRRAIQLDPKDSEAYYRLGIVATNLGKFRDAFRALERAYDLDSKNEDAARRLTEMLIRAYVQDPRANKLALDDARAVVDRILKTNPKSYTGLRLSADLATANQDRKTAIQLLRQANAANPWQPETIMALVENLSRDGQQQEAEQLARELNSRRKDFPAAYDLLYYFYLRASKLGPAEDILKAKVRNLPADGAARVELAGFYYMRNRRPEMLAMLNTLRADRKKFPEADLRIGDFYARVGDYESAVQAYREGEKSDPKLTASLEKRVAEIRIVQGRNDEALSIVSKLQKDNPKDEEAAAMRATLLARGNPQQVQKAIDELESLVSKDIGNPILQLSLGRVYSLKGDRESLDKARAHLATAISLRGDLLSAKLALSEVQLARGESRDAVQIAEEILTVSPGNPYARLTRATGLAKMGELQKARDELLGILRVQKDFNEARYRLAWIDFADKRYPLAETEFLDLIRNGDSRGVTGLAKCKESQGQAGAAAQLLEQELAKFPDRDDYRIAFVDVEYNLGRYQQARTELERLVQKRPSSSSLQARLGDVLFRLGQNDAAIQCFEKARQLEPANVSATLSLAVLLDATHQADRARAAYEDVLKISPENAQALNNLAYMKAEQGVDLDMALNYAQRALRQSPTDPNISDTLGLIYIRKKLTGQAVSILRDLVSRKPDNPSFHFHLGMALFDAGDKQLARKELELALRHKPSEAEEAKIRELVARIG